MTTSLAALAAASQSHHPSSSPNILMSSPTQQQSTNAANSSNNLIASSVSASSSANLDSNDSNYEIKTEFYTREGIWRLIQSCDYVRHLQNQTMNSSNLHSSFYQSQLVQNSSSNQGMSPNTSNAQYNSPSTPNYSSSNHGQQNVYSNSNGTVSNDQVKLGIFKFSNDMFGLSNVNGSIQNEENVKQSLEHNSSKKLVCDECLKLNKGRSTNVNKFILSNSEDESDEFEATTDVGGVTYQNVDDDDDDNDVIYPTKSNNKLHSNCKLCNKNFVSNRNIPIKSANKCLVNTSISSPSLDIIIFNYGREIYTYEFNPLTLARRQQESSKALGDTTTSTKNLIDKKVYKTFISSCFDINVTASTANTLAHQARVPVIGNSNGRSPEDNNLAINLSPSYLSLIVAAGFNKGEIHVFDVFKKDASVFYNNTKLVDKTKVTCIKWLPNSINLFLASYSSGSMYLFDASNLTQATVGPVFTKLIQTDSFSLHVNNNASSTSTSAKSLTNEQMSDSLPNTSTLPSQKASSIFNQQNNSSNSLNKTSLNQCNNSTSNQPMPLKLVLSNTNQSSQVAKNPLIKLTIGNTYQNEIYSSSSMPNTSSTSSTSTNSSSSNASICYGGVNGVNEFSFSPCGKFLAVVSQDGFLRVFTFIYKSNQQMQIEFRCSMKSYFGGLLCLTWSNDGKYIATGGEDDLITLFSFEEMRVVLRGRGHSSWINCLSFDPWTLLTNCNDAFANHLEFNLNAKSSSASSLSSNNRSQSNNLTHAVLQNDKNESDLEEDYHQNQQKIKNQININNNFDTNENNTGWNQHSELSNMKISAPKKRTISTLSDFNTNQSYSNRQSNSANSTVSAKYYRLASCGQDNQICFWDLTEDVLKERAQTQLNSRSRVASAAINSTSASNSTYSQSQLSSSSSSSQTITTGPSLLLPQIVLQPNSNNHHHHHHHHSTASSLVSTAKNLFSSSKHESSNKLAQLTNKLSLTNENNDSEDFNSISSNKTSGTIISTSSGIGSSISSTATGFFKKHKRNQSTNNASSEKLTGSNSKNQQIVLNSYKKSSGVFSNSSKINEDTNNSDSSVGLSKKSSFSTQSKQQHNQQQQQGPFNLCPKLDQIPMIEPLICKRISNERLTSIIFKRDCFVVATQDGLVNTWSRPLNKVFDDTVNENLSVKQTNTNQTNQTPLSSIPTPSNTNDNVKVNFTSL